MIFNLLGWMVLLAVVVWIVSSMCGASPGKSLVIAALAVVVAIAIFIFVLLLNGDR